MAQNVVFNGVVYSIPHVGDDDYGQNLTDYFIAIASGTLQKTGGTFTLTADANFGASFGLRSLYFRSRDAIIATDGLVRLSVTNSIGWRNNANGANLLLAVNGSDQLTFNGTVIQSAVSVTDTTTVDLTLTGSALSADVRSDSLTNTQINSAAAVALTKLAATTASRALVSDGSGVISPATTTATEIGFVNGVTSAIQTQLNAKVNTSDTIAINRGGTGQTTQTTAFDALSPMSASGDIIYGGTAGTGTRLPAGTDGHVLSLAAGLPSWAAPAASPTQAYETNNLGLACSVAGNALTIALKQSDGSTDPTTGAGAVNIGFRSSTATAGSYNVRNTTAALSLVISSGSTLGHASGVSQAIWVYALDNAGTVELAVSSVKFDEGSLQSTTAEGGAGAADSNRVLYSTTARSSVPIRVIGRLRSTQTTAGTWAAVPTEVTVSPSQLALVETISAGYYMSANAGASTTQTANFDTKLYDTHNAVSAAAAGTGTWSFTAPIAGIYKFSGPAFLTTAVTPNVVMYKNGTAFQTAGSLPTQGSYSCSIKLVAGDTVDLRLSSSLTLNGGAPGTSNSSIFIERAGD